MSQAVVEASIIGTVKGDGIGPLPSADEMLAKAGSGRASRLGQGQGLSADAELGEPETETGNAADSDRLAPEQGAVAGDRGCEVLHRHCDTRDPALRERAGCGP